MFSESYFLLVIGSLLNLKNGLDKQFFHYSNHVGPDLKYTLSYNSITKCDMKNEELNDVGKTYCENECRLRYLNCLEYLYNPKARKCVLCLNYDVFEKNVKEMGYEKHVAINFDYFVEAKYAYRTNCFLQDENYVKFNIELNTCFYYCLKNYPACTEIIYQEQKRNCYICVHFTEAQYDLKVYGLTVYVDSRYRCKSSKTSSYNGVLSTNVRGVACQSWNVNFPNQNDYIYKKDNYNFCRSFDDQRAWCFNSDTTNPSWTYCEVFVCVRNGD